mgnify:CR=1 FL=1
MTGQQDPVVFKSEDALWRQLQSGERRFDMRRWDMSDERIYRLAWGRLTNPGGYVPDVKEVTFVNKLTGEALTLEFTGLEYTTWAPGWVFLVFKPFVAGE